jgi:hypothetical protein
MRKQIGNITLPVNTTFSPFLRVKLSGGYLALAASTEDEVGVLEQNVISTDVVTSVIPIDDPASRQGVASKSIAQYAQVYAAANGQLSDSGTLLRGTALIAASGANSIFEYLPARTTTSGTIARTQLTTETGSPYPVVLTGLKTHATLVGLGTAAGTPAGDCGLTPGTCGTNTPVVIGEAASGNSKSDAARFLFELPKQYVAGAAVTLKVRAKVTVAATVSATLQAAAYRADGAAGVSANLQAGAAQALTTAFADYTFTITPTALNPGDTLDVLLTLAVNDTGGTTGAVGEISAVTMLLNSQG